MPFLCWLDIWQQYVLQQNVLNMLTFTSVEHNEKFLIIRLLHRAYSDIPLYLNILLSSDKSFINIVPRNIFLGAIQVLGNSVGGLGVGVNFPGWKKALQNVHGSTLLGVG